MIPTVINHGIKTQIPVYDRMELARKANPIVLIIVTVLMKISRRFMIMASFIMYRHIKRTNVKVSAVETAWTAFVPLRYKDVILDFNLN